MSTLIVFCHGRWDYVFRRPQQLMTRLARQHQVICIEEPQADSSASPHLERLDGPDGITVLRPRLGLPEAGWNDAALARAIPLLERLDGAFDDDTVAWVYTPMAQPLLATLHSAAVVYDCTDDLATQADAPSRWSQREALLLKASDLVLTAGPSLLQARRALHGNVHCLPSAVDAAHFAPERITANCEQYLAAEALQGRIQAPRLGFFGVIDERIDLGLIAALADRRPQWHVVMVGPIARAASQVPQRPNLHWLGAQPHARLPALVAGWDVCLLPYALNERTRWLSPTKTLEYLAAEKPVVSTAVADVIGMYGDVVQIAASAGAFVEACDQVLAETPRQRAQRLMQSSACVSRFSWDEAARTAQRLLELALAQRRGASAAPDLRPWPGGGAAPPPAVSSSGGTW